jgi:PelA/Pel-15E family pectate lyase
MILRSSVERSTFTGGIQQPGRGTRSFRSRCCGAVLLAVAAIGLGERVAAAPRVRDFLSKPETWFAGDEARRVAAAIVSHQSDAGGWPKNTDTVSRPHTGDRATLQPTFDNGATVDELRFLAKIVAVTGDETARRAFDRGLAYVLAAQYPGGGWPQCYPLVGGYPDHVTFNDDAMVRVMRFVMEVGGDPTYGFVAEPRKQACREAFDRGVACILRCQIVVDGRRTVWCAQHDPESFAPAQARAYELPSFSGSESVGIVRLLMSIEDPAPEVREAIEAAVDWFRDHAITGQRLDNLSDAGGRPDRVLVPDPNAAPLWARFYDLQTGRPFVCDRDGIPRAKLADIGSERRTGYNWFSPYARTLLDEDYPAWKRRLP